MTPNVERMRRNEEEEPGRGYPPSVVRVPQRQEQGSAGHDRNAYAGLSDMSGVSPERVVQNMRAANLGPQLSMPDERSMNQALEREPHFSGMPAQRSGEPSLMGFLTDGESWNDMGRNAKDVAVSIGKIPVKTADLLVNTLDLFTDGNKVSSFLRENIGYRPGDAMGMMESQRSDEGREIKQGYDEAEGFVGKAKYLWENPRHAVHVLADVAPEMLVSAALGSLGKLGGAARLGAQGVASGLTDGASTLHDFRQASGNGLVTRPELDVSRRGAASGAILSMFGNGMTRNVGLGRKVAGQTAVGALNGGLQQFYKNVGNDAELGRNMDAAMIGGGFSAAGNPFEIEGAFKPRSFR